MYLQRPVAIAVSRSLALAGCATSSQDIAAAYALSCSLYVLGGTKTQEAE